MHFPSGKAYARKAAVLALGCLFALLALELGLRAFSAWQMRHEPAEALSAESGEKLILCLGNSHTHGLSVAPALTYPAQLEALLKKHYPGGRFRVVNAGLANRNSSDILGELPALLKKYKPVAVAAMAGENKIVLSDVSQGFRALEAREPGAAISERYFRKEGESFQDDHLNGAGNAVVAELLLKSLEAAGVTR